jgi:7-keto-8-aminopelargonate synthetase-like enzyme
LATFLAALGAFATTRAALSATLLTAARSLTASATPLPALLTAAGALTASTALSALPTLLASARATLLAAGTAVATLLTAAGSLTASTTLSAFLATLTLGHRRLLPLRDAFRGTRSIWLRPGRKDAVPRPEWTCIMPTLRNQNREQHHPRYFSSDCQPSHS